MKTYEKLYLLMYFGCANDTLLGILGTYLKHGIVTVFDTLYVNKMFNKTNFDKVI